MWLSLARQDLQKVLNEASEDAVVTISPGLAESTFGVDYLGALSES